VAADNFVKRNYHSKPSRIASFNKCQRISIILALFSGNKARKEHYTRNQKVYALRHTVEIL
jgi:hypothetical protein